MCGWVGAWTRVQNDGVVLCLCKLCVWILCVDGRSRFLYILVGGCRRIFGAPSVQSRCPLSIEYLFVADIANPDLFVFG